MTFRFREPLLITLVALSLFTTPVMAQQHQHAGQDEHMEAMKAMDAELDERLAAMNQATGDAKVEAMADVIALMAEQRSSMQGRMMQMHEQMQSHMAMCPMMQDMEHGDGHQMDHDGGGHHQAGDGDAAR